MRSIVLLTDQIRLLRRQLLCRATRFYKWTMRVPAVIALLLTGLWGKLASADILTPIHPAHDYSDQFWMSLTPFELLIVLGGLLAVVELIFFLGLLRTRRKFRARIEDLAEQD
jgi:hypothetical protein